MPDNFEMPVKGLRFGLLDKRNGRAKWSLYLETDDGVGRGDYVLDETMAWRLMYALTGFLADHYRPGIFIQSESLSETPSVVTGSSTMPSGNRDGCQ